MTASDGRRQIGSIFAGGGAGSAGASREPRRPSPWSSRPDEGLGSAWGPGPTPSTSGCSQSALSRCEPRNGRRPAPELSGTLGRSRGSELCGPAFATSRYSGRVGRVDAGADDGTTLGGGEGEGSPRLHYVTCIELTAIIADGARGSSGGSSGAGCRFPAPGARAGVCGCSTI